MGLTLNTALQIATSGIQTNQAALGVSSHNIANANTPGFHKQTAVFASRSLNGTGDGSLLSAVVRNEDAFLDQRVATQTARAAYASTYLDKLEGIETLFGNPTGNAGLDKQVTDFFNTLSNLANYPDSSAQKQNVLQQADLLVDSIRDLNRDLTDAQTRLNADVNTAVDSINTILENIHELNLQISDQQNSSSIANASDLKDARQREIDKLSGYFGVQISDAENGAVRIVLENGRTLIDTANYAQLERSPASPYEGVAIRRVLVDGSLAASALGVDFSTLTGGSLKAVVDARDTAIPNVLSELDEFTQVFATEFNKIHSQGSAFPPVRTYTSGNTSGIANAATDLLANLASPFTSGDSFHISVVDSNGDVLATTVGNGGPVTIPVAATYSINDLVGLINGNADVGTTALAAANNSVTASAGVDANGNPILQVQGTGANVRVVMSNVSGDFLGDMGMNNFFTGTTSGTLAIRSDIAAAPTLVAVGQMRATDGGLSSQDNRNAIALANLANGDNSFAAAGSLAASTNSFTGFVGQIFAGFAITVQSFTDRAAFNSDMLFELQEQKASAVGVNMDEELSQLLIFQNAYQASARVLQTVDEMLDFLLNRLG